MPYEIMLPWKPMGYATRGGVKGEKVPVAMRDFSSSSDGEHFYARLDGAPTEIVRALPASAGIAPSNVDHLLAFVRGDLTATVYVNELPHLATVRSARAIGAGERVSESDFADVSELRFPGIEVPSDAGIVAILSVGWRKALFFDYFPLHQPEYVRPYDLWKVLGECWSYLIYHAPFQMSDEDWSYLVASGWFPFTTLPFSSRRSMIGFARSRMDVDLVLECVRDHLASALDQMLDRWSCKAAFAPHMALLRHAIDEYREGDFVSATAIVLPRIEGLMREVHVAYESIEKASSTNLTKRLVEGRMAELHEYSWLLPRHFIQFLQGAYFAGFEPGTPASLSRHSLAHGVAKPEDFNEKSATTALLTIDQIFWFLP